MERSRGLATVRGLDYTMLLCADVGAMRTFYADVVGLTVERELPGRYVEFRVGASVLALRRRGRTYDGPAPAAGTACVQLAFRVPASELDLVRRQLAERGVEPLEPVRVLPEFGHRVLFVPDPERNVVEFYAEL